jgi:SNF2 family DNA or RNA helicase
MLASFWLSVVLGLIYSSVIFSFWKTTLEVVGAALEAAKIDYLRVDGDVPPKKRNAMLLQFQTRSASRVLLMTFSTGGVGYVPYAAPRCTAMFSADMR